MRKERPSFKTDQETIPYLEEARRYYLGRSIIDLMIALLFALAGIALLVIGSIFEQGRFLLIFGILGLALLLLVPIIFILKAKRRPRQFKMALYSTLLLLYAFASYDNFAFMYQLDEEREKKEFLLKEFKPLQEDATSRYKGNMHKVTFTSFAYTYKQNQEKGRYIAFKLPVFVHFPVLLLNRKDHDLFHVPENLKQTVIQDDELFTKEFEIFSEDDKEGRRVIHDQRRKGVIQLEKELNCTISLLFKDNRCFVYLNGFNDSYTPSLFRSVSQRDLDGVKAMVDRIHHIYQVLNLDFGNE